MKEQAALEFAKSYLENHGEIPLIFDAEIYQSPLGNSIKITGVDGHQVLVEDRFAHRMYIEKSEIELREY